MQLFFAGGEAWADLLLDMGVKNQLFSYFYFRSSLRTNGQKARSLLARMRRAKQKGYRFMLDSGAFTYNIKSGKAGSTLPPPFAYFDEYFEFCKDYGDLFDVIVEFDVDGFVTDPETGEKITTPQIDELTNRMLDWPGLNHRIMPVYHPHRGRKWMLDWLQDMRSPLVGISSSTLEGNGALIAMAHRFGKFVHGFAQTRIKTDIKYTPFDSVDSTTWLRADKYGGTCIFRNGKFIVLDHLHKADRRIYRAWYESWGLDFAKIAKDDLHENRMATIIAWRELANSFEEKWHYRSGGKYPWIYQAVRDGKQVPDVHPLTQAMQQQVPPT